MVSKYNFLNIYFICIVYIPYNFENLDTLLLTLQISIHQSSFWFNTVDVNLNIPTNNDFQ